MGVRGTIIKTVDLVMAMETDEKIKITKQILMDNRTKKGAWTRFQLDVLGVEWPPKKGWHDQVIGLRLSDEEFQNFIDGKNIFIKYKKK